MTASTSAHCHHEGLVRGYARELVYAPAWTVTASQRNVVIVPKKMYICDGTEYQR